MPIAVGMAIASKLKKQTRYFVVCGDGEINEGSIWEALLSAAKHKLDNLIIFVDYQTAILWHDQRNFRFGAIDRKI